MAVAEKTGSDHPWQPILGADPGRLRLLGELLRMRRAAIGYRHVPAFVRARGINTRMAGDIEHGRRDTYTYPSLLDVAAAYEVTCESMTDVVHADASELVPAEAGARGPDPSPPFDDPAREAGDRPFFDEINERRVELATKGIAYPTGAQMFGEGTKDAEAWDNPETGGRLPIGKRVWFIADLRRLAGGRPNSGTGVTGA